MLGVEDIFALSPPHLCDRTARLLQTNVQKENISQQDASGGCFMTCEDAHVDDYGVLQLPRIPTARYARKTLTCSRST
jgi:hypothetical protein